LEFEFVDKNSNIKEYILKIYDDSNNIITKLNGSNSIIRDIILPKINITVEKLISKIEIIIISTTDNKPTNHVKISIKGYSPGCISTTKYTTQHLTKTSRISLTSRSGPSKSSSESTLPSLSTASFKLSSSTQKITPGTVAPSESSSHSSSSTSSLIATSNLPDTIIPTVSESTLQTTTSEITSHSSKISTPILTSHVSSSTSKYMKKIIQIYI
jgi:hypothetical protein